MQQCVARAGASAPCSPAATTARAASSSSARLLRAGRPSTAPLTSRTAQRLAGSGALPHGTAEALPCQPRAGVGGGGGPPPLQPATVLWLFVLLCKYAWSNHGFPVFPPSPAA